MARSLLPRQRRRTLGFAIAVALLLAVPVLWEEHVASGASSPAIPGLELASPPVPVFNFSTYLDSPSRDSSLLGTPNLIVSGASLPALAWNLTLPGYISSQPIVHEGVVYLGGGDGFEYALSAATGSVLWKTYLGVDPQKGCGPEPIGITSTATYSNGELYVFGGDSDAYALDAVTGEIEWNVSIGGPTSAAFYLWSSPLVYSGSVYVGIASRCADPLVSAGIERLSQTSGAELAYLDTSVPTPSGSSIWSTPSVDPALGAIYVTTGNPGRVNPTNYSEAILELNASSLAVRARWQVPAAQRVPDGDFGTTPSLFTLPNGTPAVAAENKNGYLYAWAQSGLRRLWADAIGSGQDNHYTAAYGSGRLYVEGNTWVDGSVTYNTSLSGINPANGHFLWRDGFNQSALGGYATPLFLGRVLVAPIGHDVYFVAANNGTVLAVLPATGLVIPPASSDGPQLFVAEGSTLCAYTLAYA